LVLFAGRHVPDKGIRPLLEALVIVRRSKPDLRAVIVGDGPERAAVLDDLGSLQLESAVSAPGFVSREELDQLLGRATCLAYPSIRDGYGMVVAEAIAAGLPAVVCRASDNAATELVEEGVNGAIADDASPSQLAAAILNVVENAESLRGSTATWYEANADRLSMHRSIERVLQIYDSPSGPAGRRNGPGAEQGDEAGQVGGDREGAARAATSGSNGRLPSPVGSAETAADHDAAVELDVRDGVGQ
jgi:glycosyltransferase involved in cell wall biosynthesis